MDSRDNRKYEETKRGLWLTFLHISKYKKIQEVKKAMLTESAKKFMDALKNDPKAKELLKDMPKPETKEAVMTAYIDLAGKLGITLSEEDVKCFVEEEKDVAARSENAAKAIQELPDDELDNVAGGWSGAEGNCDNTYKSIGYFRTVFNQ